jgi:type I restriction enzyme M protein
MKSPIEKVIGVRALEQEIKAREKATRDAYVKAAAIDAAVFDLKAVNPNAVAKTDTRTPAEIIASIEVQSKIVSAALSNLKKLLAEPD